MTRLTGTGCPCRVSLDEVAAAVGLPFLGADAMTQRGAVVEPDWAGRPSISTTDAARIVPRWLESIDDQRAEQLAAVAEAERQSMARQDREASVYQTAHRAALIAGHGAGQAVAAGMRAVAKLRGEPAPKIEKVEVS